MFESKLAIDFGTYNTRIYSPKKGMVFDEATVIALSETFEVITIGNEAKSMLGRVSNKINAIKPLKEGIVTNLKGANLFLSHVLQQYKSGLFTKLVVLISINAGSSSVSKRALKEALEKAGAYKIHFIDEVVAAALGAGLPSDYSKGHLIVNMGGGITEIGMVSVNNIVKFKIDRFSGDSIIEALIEYLKSKYFVEIGDHLAEFIMKEVGSAVKLNTLLVTTIHTKDIFTGKPVIMKITSDDFTNAIEMLLKNLCVSIRSVIEVSPPELASDVIEKGIVLTGGLANIRNIDESITREIGIPVHIAQDPEYSVITGLSKIANEWKNI